MKTVLSHTNSGVTTQALWATYAIFIFSSTFSIAAGGGKLMGAVDRPLAIPANRQRVREEHLFILHVLVELIERDLCA
jgi:hypothetical protein